MDALTRKENHYYKNKIKNKISAGLFKVGSVINKLNLTPDLTSLQSEKCVDPILKITGLIPSNSIFNVSTNQIFETVEVLKKSFEQSEILKINLDEYGVTNATWVLAQPKSSLILMCTSGGTNLYSWVDDIYSLHSSINVQQAFAIFNYKKYMIIIEKESNNLIFYSLEGGQEISLEKTLKGKIPDEKETHIVIRNHFRIKQPEDDLTWIIWYYGGNDISIVHIDEGFQSDIKKNFLKEESVKDSQICEPLCLIGISRPHKLLYLYSIKQKFFYIKAHDIKKMKDRIFNLAETFANSDIMLVKTYCIEESVRTNIFFLGATVLKDDSKEETAEITALKMASSGLVIQSSYSFSEASFHSFIHIW